MQIHSLFGTHPTMTLNPQSQVKAYTYDDHQRLEESLNLLRNPGISEGDYRHLLELMLDFYEPAEIFLTQEFSADVKAKLDFSARLKSGWLKRDLRALKSSKSRSAKNSIAFSGKAYASPARQLGLMYVMEGATLGGQVIARRFEMLFPRWIDATRFYRSYEKDLGTRWMNFQRVIGEEIKTLEDVAEYCEGAKEAFRGFQRAIKSWSGMSH
ncbi:MAG TPA: biliverdin-producing heme oxygenase [Bdellovibrionota bacterium]|nr:biliverdin-producing heme oxygenase [Bdellovibrionota bacterium]